MSLAAVRRMIYGDIFGDTMSDRMMTDCEASTAQVSTRAPAEISRRDLLAWGSLLGLAPFAAFADTYPSRPIGLVVGAPPGGSVDFGARDRKSTRLNSSHIQKSRMPSSA